MHLKTTFTAFALLAATGLAQAVPLPAGWTCNGNCGEFFAPDGDVTLPPGLSAYGWISTEGGLNGVGTLPTGALGSETNGSFAQTPPFSASAGDQLVWYFNYLTTDGGTLTDYAWAALLDSSNTVVSYLFTARTTPSGNTVPGSGLPALGAGVTLTPATSAVIATGPLFSPLGPDSGGCWDPAACGYTDWIKMDYTFSSAGNYFLAFGVTNVEEDFINTALAFNGTLNGKPFLAPSPSSVPEPASTALFGLGLAGLAALRRQRGRKALKNPAQF